MMLALLAISGVTVGEVCAAIVTVVGAAKLIVDTVEACQRVKKAAAAPKQG